MTDTRFILEYALMGCRVVTGDGRRAYVQKYVPGVKYGVIVKSGSDLWTTDEHGRPSDGTKENRIYTSALRKGEER